MEFPSDDWLPHLDMLQEGRRDAEPGRFQDWDVIDFDHGGQNLLHNVVVLLDFIYEYAKPRTTAYKELMSPMQIRAVGAIAWYYSMIEAERRSSKHFVQLSIILDVDSNSK